MDDLFQNAKVFILTVDCFLQIASGASAFSPKLLNVTWKACIVDEVHLLDLFSMVGIASAVHCLLMLYDQDHIISRVRKGNKHGLEAVAKPGDFYRWQRAIYGGTHMSPWMCMRSEDIPNGICEKSDLDNAG